MHGLELGDIVAVLLLGDHPDVLVLLLLVAASPNLKRVLNLFQMNLTHHLTALLFSPQKLPVLIVSTMAWPGEGISALK